MFPVRLAAEGSDGPPLPTRRGIIDPTPRHVRFSGDPQKWRLDFHPFPSAGHPDSDMAFAGQPEDHMSDVSVVGLGAMGSALARVLQFR
jgi:hypothetical protein